MMASYRLLPDTTVVEGESDLEWGAVEWASEGQFADADHDEPGPNERRFYTIAVRRGWIESSDVASIAVLGVTRDLELGHESRFRAERNRETGEWTLCDREGIPASVCKRPAEDSTIPSDRRDRYREILERAHDVDDAVTETSETGGFERANELRADGGETECGKRDCERTDTVSYGGPQVKVRCERHALEAADGIGPTTAERLYEEFGSLESICYAARYRRTEIARLQGFSPDSASTLEDRLESAGVWIDPDTGAATDGGEHEAELVDRAVREAVQLIEKGDSERVAVRYVVDEHDLDHRRDDVLERVRERRDDERTLVTDGGQRADHTDRCEVCGDPLNEHGNCPAIQTMIDGIEELTGRSLQTDTNRNADTDGGRDRDAPDRQAFLAGDAHWCDICSRPFDTLAALIRHDCDDAGRVAADDGRRSATVSWTGPGEVHGNGGDRR